DIPPKKITLVKRPHDRRSLKSRGQSAAAETILVVTEDNHLKDKQEKFLLKRNKFKIKSSEAEIRERQEALFEEQEDVFKDREELGRDKSLEKARAAHEKQITAFSERKAAFLKARVGEARLLKPNPG